MCRRRSVVTVLSITPSGDFEDSRMSKLPDFSKARLPVVGDVMLDRHLFGEVNRILPEAPDPIVKV